MIQIEWTKTRTAGTNNYHANVDESGTPIAGFAYDRSARAWILTFAADFKIEGLRTTIETTSREHVEAHIERRVLRIEAEHQERAERRLATPLVGIDHAEPITPRNPLLPATPEPAVEVEVEEPIAEPPPVILSYGMGVDSTAILLRWLEDPSSRDFDLSRLIVLTAQTGNEFESTGALVETHILPRLRAAGVRFVEIGRNTKSQSDGIAVLQDSTNPTALTLAGKYSLSDELTSAGTIPASGGTHLCSIKSKGAPLDSWIEREFVDRDFVHAMGFNADETKRVRKDIVARASKGQISADVTESYRIAFGFNADEMKRVVKGLEARAKKGQATPEFPLVDWAWTYDDCLDYIESVTGARWLKSCCSFCPFAGGRGPIVARYNDEPQAAADALMLEHVALAFNHRMALYKTKTLREIVSADGNQTAIDLFDARLLASPHAIYRVRRIYSGPGKAIRKVERVDAIGTREEIEARLLAMGGTQVVEIAGSLRIPMTERTESYPAPEGFLVAAPATVESKSGSKTFDAQWNALVEVDLAEREIADQAVAEVESAEVAQVAELPQSTPVEDRRTGSRVDADALAEWFASVRPEWRDALVWDEGAADHAIAYDSTIFERADELGVAAQAAGFEGLIEDLIDVAVDWVSVRGRVPGSQSMHRLAGAIGLARQKTERDRSAA